jgi:hypothetical protein
MVNWELELDRPVLSLDVQQTMATSPAGSEPEASSA